MKRYFLYELKRNFFAIVIFTAICTVVYVTSVFNSTFVHHGINFEGSPYTYSSAPPIYIPVMFLCLLTIIVPVMMFSFKTNRRSCDAIYSLPLTRKKIYLVKSLVGLVIVLAPFLISYWLGFLAVLPKENIFNLAYFVPLFFVIIPIAALIYGINTFVFTRANKVIDGIIFMGMYACIGATIALPIYTKILSAGFFNMFDAAYLFTYSPIIIITSGFSYLIENRGAEYAFLHQDLIAYIFIAIMGIAAWFLLFFNLEKEKAENAEQVSSSWYGYKVLLPIYIICLLGTAGFNTFSFMSVTVSAIVGFIIYRRTFNLSKNDWFIIAVSLAVGVLFSVL